MSNSNNQKSNVNNHNNQGPNHNNKDYKGKIDNRANQLNPNYKKNK